MGKCPPLVVLALVGSNWLWFKCSDVFLASGSQPLICKPWEISAALHVKNSNKEGTMEDNCSAYMCDTYAGKWHNKGFSV